MGAWTCPNCGTSWSEQGKGCARCGATQAPGWAVNAPQSPGGPPAAMDVPAPAPANAGSSWGRERALGQLFTDAFRLFLANRGWAVRVAMIGTLVSVACELAGIHFVGKGNPDWTEPVTRAWVRGLPTPDGFWTVVFLTFLAGTLATAFVRSAVFGTLAALGRGRSSGTGGAIRIGLEGFSASLAVILSVGIRVLLWLPLFVVPGIIKSYALSLSLPARLSGDAPTAGAALEVSQLATDGKKLVLFVYDILMVLVAVGIMLPVIAVKMWARYSSISWLTGACLVTHEFVMQLLGVVTLMGYWLVYADSVAARNPQSPASTFATRAR